MAATVINIAHLVINHQGLLITAAHLCCCWSTAHQPCYQHCQSARCQGVFSAYVKTSRICSKHLSLKAIIICHQSLSQHITVTGMPRLSLSSSCHLLSLPTNFQHLHLLVNHWDSVQRSLYILQLSKYINSCLQNQLE